MTRLAFDSRSLEDTRRLGHSLGQAALPGLIVALYGTLGAGKTAFVRAVAEGLNISDPRAVCSPTFVLVHEYEARLPIYHFDVYRLPGVDAFLDLGAEEYFSAGGVCLIEWADKVQAALPADRLDVRFEVASPTDRSIVADAPARNASLAADVLRRWRDLFSAGA